MDRAHDGNCKDEIWLRSSVRPGMVPADFSGSFSSLLAARASRHLVRRSDDERITYMRLTIIGGAMP
jgi:hypothetical protein